MVRIPLVGSDKCYEAAEWCEQHLNRTNWEMWMEHTWTRYTFEFQRSEDAAWFALKWAS